MRFTVNGRPLDAEPRTTVAAALLNAGIVNFRRSVRGEPRAPLCAMGICHECRVTIDGVAHQRSCLVAVRNGMRIDTGVVQTPFATTGEPHARTLDADVAVVGAGPAGIAAAIAAAGQGKSVVVIDEGLRAGGQIWRHRAGARAAGQSSTWLERLERSSVELLHSASVSHMLSNDRGTIITAEQSGAP